MAALRNVGQQAALFREAEECTALVRDLASMPLPDAVTDVDLSPGASQAQPRGGDADSDGRDADDADTGGEASTAAVSEVLAPPGAGGELAAVLAVQSDADLSPSQLAQRKCARVEALVQPYQEQSQLLDPHLDDLIEPLLAVLRAEDAEPLRRNIAFRLLYVFTKIRGFKTIIKHFSHEAEELHAVLRQLEAQDPEDHNLWTNRYILLLWLSVVCMLPFDMHVFDDAAKGGPSLPERIMSLCRQYLQAADLTPVAAAQLAARLVTRPDMRAVHLPAFVDWCIRIIHENCNEPAGAAPFRVSGAMGALTTIYKIGRRQDLLPLGAPLLTMMSTANLAESNNTLTRKLCTKLVQRIGMNFLPPRLAPWRYQRGQRSLAANLAATAPEGTDVAAAALASAAASAAEVAARDAGEEDEDDYDIPEEIEAVLEQLLSGLADRDTVVRWSAAKGVGRVTGRLPRELADEVVESLLDLFTLQQTDSAWHGGCLALAELGRRGLLLPARLPQVVPVVLRALGYDEVRGATSVGAHVRDAASYVCWAFARAYDPTVLQAYVGDLAAQLLVTALFDRENNVRRAAAAAFQENVGRLGTVPHGIAVIGVADYYSVGNRAHAYLQLSPRIAAHVEYRGPLLQHLCDVKLGHWDKEVRELAAQAAGRLVVHEPALALERLRTTILRNVTSIDLHTRHGAVLAVGHLVRGLAAAQASQKESAAADTSASPTATDATPAASIATSGFAGMDSETQAAVAGLLAKLEAARYFRGMGGALVHAAACWTVHNLAEAGFPAGESYPGGALLLAWLAFIRDSLAHVEEDLRKAAVAAFRAVTQAYLVSTSEGQACFDVECLVPLTAVLRASTSQCHKRMGAARALGDTPPALALRFANQLVDTLVDAAKFPDQETENLAEARAAAIRGLCCVCDSILDADPSALTAALAQRIFDALVRGLDDYTIDRRGDVGSNVRSAAMDGLARLTQRLAHAGLVPQTAVTAAIQGLVKQAMEKIDRIRQQAGETLLRLLTGEMALGAEHVEGHDILDSIIKTATDKLDWAAPSATFPLLMPLLGVSCYARHALSGLLLSVGGMTESLVRQSGHALITYVMGLDVARQEALALLFVDVGEASAKDDRVILPLFQTLELLCTHGCLDVLSSEESETFSARAVAFIRSELKGCGNVGKLVAAASLLCEFLNFPQCRRVVLGQLAILLSHRFPRVRRNTAERFYVATISLDNTVPEAAVADVIELLVSTPWDMINAEAARSVRDQICTAIGIPAPKLKKGTAARSEAPAASLRSTELDTYKDLVERTGY